ncbi:MAG: response regulator [Candidatus Peribacteraceae bacterium]|nr:response regulator [Candidatus Peribacteraceae bacterium]
MFKLLLQPAKESISMSKKRILIVDDEETILILIESLLKTEGFDVITANNGAEGLSVAKKETPDLVLLDIMMPGTNGIEVAEKIRSNKEIKKTKIIFLTVVRSNEVRSDRLTKIGADDYITKPFDNIDLVERVKKVLS